MHFKGFLYEINGFYYWKAKTEEKQTKQEMKIIQLSMCPLKGMENGWKILTLNTLHSRYLLQVVKT